MITLQQPITLWKKASSPPNQLLTSLQPFYLSICRYFRLFSKYSIVNSVIHPISKSPDNIKDIGHKRREENSDVVNNDYVNNGKYTKPTPSGSSRTTSTHCIHHALRCILVALIVSATMLISIVAEHHEVNK
jgi:hypothetical protein